MLIVLIFSKKPKSRLSIAYTFVQYALIIGNLGVLLPVLNVFEFVIVENFQVTKIYLLSVKQL